MSIRSRLLLLVLSVLLPAAAAGLWLLAQTYRAELEVRERNLRDTTRALAMVVGRELDQRAAIARVLALSPTLDDAPALTPEMMRQFEQQARRALQGLDGWVELSVPAALLPAALPPAAGAGSAPAVRLLPSAALRSGPAVGPLAAVPGGQQLRAALLQPVQRDGRTLMNLAVTILPAELQEIIDAQNLPADWVGAVLDDRGTIVARNPGGVAYAGRPATPDLRERLRAGGEGPFESVTLDGAAVSGFFSTSPQGWSYVTAVPRLRLAGGVPPAVAKAAAAALLLLVLTVAGALWVARRIAGPVQSLKRAALDLQAGRPVLARATGIVECDEVAAALAEAAEAMRHAQTDLELQVAAAVERTRAAEQRVSQSQRVEALGRLTGGVAHDFNNLLGIISNSAHLMERQLAANPALQMPLAATLRAVEVGSRLTQTLMRFAGRQTVRPQLVDLTRALPDAQELLKTVLGSRIALEVAVAADTAPVRVDAGELELALINLALNARDAMQGGGHLWLRARNADAADKLGLGAGAYVLLTVTDDGSGVDETLAVRVFEPFFTTKPVGKGTGLGLSQVHGFCAQAGGIARLASTPGLGTTVSLLLPAGAPQPADGDAATATAATANAECGLVGARVLLVEDNEALGDMTAAVLVSYGCKLLRADGPAAALRLLADGSAVDVVLSDVVMPGAMDGIALGRHLRAHYPALPVVLISGYSSALAAAQDFVVLRKPCPAQELVAALQQAMTALPQAR